MILFIGAGASEPFGIPATKRFAGKLTEHLRDIPHVRDAIDLLEAIRTTFADDLDLEVILAILADLSKGNPRALSSTTSYFLLSQQYSVARIEAPSIRQKAALLLEASLDYVRGIVHEGSFEHHDVILRIYDGLMKVLVSRFGSMNIGGGVEIPSSLTWIFTTNYDQCFETYLNTKGIDFEDGIRRVHGASIFDAETFQSTGKHLKLVKLHGSVDLFRTRRGDIVQADLDKTTRKEIQGRYMGRGITLESEVLLYPTEAGGDRRIMESPFIKLHSYLQQAFRHDHYVVFIGFSFRDRSIVSALQDALLASTGKPLVWLIDPCAPQIVDFLKVHGEQVVADHLLPKRISLERLQEMPGAFSDQG